MSDLSTLLIRQIFFWQDWGPWQAIVGAFVFCGLLFEPNKVRHQVVATIASFVYLLVSDFPFILFNRVPIASSDRDIAIAYTFRLIYCAIIAAKIRKWIYNEYGVFSFVKKSDDNCPICLEKEGDEFVKLKVCTHQFHEHCIAKWIDPVKNAECPVCRAPIK